MAMQLHKAMSSFSNWNNVWSDRRMGELYPERTESDVAREREREQHRLVWRVQMMTSLPTPRLPTFNQRNDIACAA